MSLASLVVKVKAGSYGRALTFTLKDSNGNALDLSGMTVKLKIWNPKTGAVLLERAVTVTSPTEGQVSFTPQQGDFDTAGLYYAEFILETDSAHWEMPTFIWYVE